MENYANEYQAAAECRESLKVDKYFNENPLSILVIWLVAVTVGTFAWCCCAGSNRNATKELDGEQQTITGYRNHIVGTALYYSVLATLVGFQLFLLSLAIASYGDSQTEVLQLFEIVWGIGFVWTFCFKWPSSIRSLFLKQCQLHQATEVFIFTKTHFTAGKVGAQDPAYIAHLRRILHITSSCFNHAMGFLFNVPARGMGQKDYVIVQTDSTGTRYFVHEFRRYIYNGEAENFEPGVISCIHKIGNVVDSKQGLTDEQVENRLRIVGPNSIEMKQPSLVSAIYTQFSRPFYVYQFYLYVMAILFCVSVNLSLLFLILLSLQLLLDSRHGSPTCTTTWLFFMEE